MKINEIKLEHYGKYKDKSLKFGQGLNVVYGQNEAGKSTLFSSLMTLLYGFKPANKEAHPYLGWDQNQLSLHGIFQNKEGLFTVERKLSSNPIGRLYRGDKELKINNRPIEEVGHLSKQQDGTFSPIVIRIAYFVLVSIKMVALPYIDQAMVYISLIHFCTFVDLDCMSGHKRWLKSSHLDLTLGQ